MHAYTAEGVSGVAPLSCPGILDGLLIDRPLLLLFFPWREQRPILHSCGEMLKERHNNKTYQEKQQQLDSSDLRRYDPAAMEYNY